MTVLTKDAKASTAERERVIAEVARFAYDYFVLNPRGTMNATMIVGALPDLM
jgi:hypothetical protein